MPVKKIILLYVLILRLYSCSEKSNQIPSDTMTDCCKLTDPVNDLPWLQQVIAGRDCKWYAGAILYKCYYNNHCVFYFTNSASNLGICGDVVYNCQGAKLFDGLCQTQHGMTSRRMLLSTK